MLALFSQGIISMSYDQRSSVVAGGIVHSVERSYAIKQEKYLICFDTLHHLLPRPNYLMSTILKQNIIYIHIYEYMYTYVNSQAYIQGIKLVYKAILNASLQPFAQSLKLPYIKEGTISSAAKELSSLSCRVIACTI